ncbi:MAG: alpha/beta hydrolase family protein, partial [bacterium]
MSTDVAGRLIFLAGSGAWLWLQFGTTVFDRSPAAAIVADSALAGLAVQFLPAPIGWLPATVLAGHAGMRAYRLMRRSGTSRGNVFWVRTKQGAPVYGELFVPPSGGNGKAVIIAHGISASAHDRPMHLMARWLLDAGYSVVFFDEPGHCHSGGTLDEDAEYGLRAVIDEVARQGFGRIGVIGLSLGALLALREASERKSYHAMIFVSGFGDLKPLKQRAGLYTNPLGRVGMRFWG